MRARRLLAILLALTMLLSMCSFETLAADVEPTEPPSQLEDDPQEQEQLSELEPEQDEPEHQHSWDEGTVTADPTCAEPGTITYSCTGCGETYSEEIQAVGHNFEDGVCTVCGENDPDAQPSAPMLRGALRSGGDKTINVSYEPYTYSFENNDLDAEGWTVVYSTENAVRPPRIYQKDEEYPGFYTKTGEYLFLFRSDYEADNFDQYLISPLLNVDDPSKSIDVTAYVRNWWAYHQIQEYHEWIAVGYSSTTNDIGSFTFGDEIEIYTDGRYIPVSAVVPAGTKYVCFKYSHDSYLLQVDDVQIVKHHDHDFSYSVDGDTITANCQEPYCTLSATPTLTIKSPTKTLVNGYGSTSATLEGLDYFCESTGLAVDPEAIRYEGAEGTSYASSTTPPAEEGNYVASLTVGGNNISVPYSILSAISRIIGTGSKTNYYVPIYGDAKHSISQQIFTTEEIGTAGIINSICFSVASRYESTGNRTMEIYLMETDKDSFVNKGDFVAMPAGSKVFDGQVNFAQVPTSGGWIQVTFDKPFTYNLTGNLLLCCVNKSGSGLDGFYSLVFNTTEMNGKAVKAYGDTAYDATNPPTSASYDQTCRSNIKLMFSYVHEHDCIYSSVSEDTVSGHCQTSGCYLDEDPTLTISAPTMIYANQTGDGISAEAVITDEGRIRGDAEVRYYVAENGNRTGHALAAPPTESGTYWAEITLGDVTAHTVYSIVDPPMEVSLDPSPTTAMMVDDVVAFTANIGPEYAANRDVIWSVSGDSIALYKDAGCTTPVGTGAVDACTVYAKGLAVGSASITATAAAEKARSASCSVSVISTTSQFILEVGNSENTGTNPYIPTSIYYNYSLTQQIYTAQEIGKKGAINSISFYYKGDKTGTRNVDLYLKNTKKTSFQSNKDWETVSSNDKVFSGNLTLTSNQWITIPLSTPFQYNGTDSLLVCLDDNTSNYIASGQAFLTSSVTDNMSVNIHSDGTNYNPLSPSSYSGTLTKDRNVIKIDINAVSTAVDSVNLSDNSLTCMQNGTGIPLTVGVTPNNAENRNLSWSVSPANTISLYADADCTTPLGSTVTSGTRVYVKGKTIGKSTLTFTSAGNSAKKASCAVEVVASDGYATVCIDLADQYNDGWNGARLTIRPVGSDEAVAVLTIDGGSADSNYLVLPNGKYEMVWTKGSYPKECSFTIKEGERTLADSADYDLENSSGVIGTFTVGHEHSFTYAVNGSVITATCSEGCPDAYDINGVTLTILAPALTEEGGSDSANATLDGLTAFNEATGLGVDADTIQYHGTGATSYGPNTTAPANWGTYTASITAGGVTASVDYAIKGYATVIVDPANGSAPATEQVEKGTAMDKPADPAWDNHIFFGWLENGSSYDFATVIVDDKTLTGSWLEVVVSADGVSLYPNDEGSIPINNLPEGVVFDWTFEPDSVLSGTMDPATGEGKPVAVGTGNGTAIFTLYGDAEKTQVIGSVEIPVTVKNVAVTVNGTEYSPEQIDEAVDAAIDSNAVLTVYQTDVPVTLEPGQSLKVKPGDKQNLGSVQVTIPADSPEAMYRLVETTDPETGITTYTCENIGKPVMEVTMPDGTVSYSLELDFEQGGTIKLLQNTNENITIPQGSTVILDLNGHVLEGTDAGQAAVTNYGNLTIVDSSEGKTGTIDSENAEYAILNYGTLNIREGNIIGPVDVRGCKDENGDVCGMATISGGNITGEIHVEQVAGAHSSNTPTLTITGGNFETEGIFVGEVTEPNSFSENADCGTVTISGGTFRKDGAKKDVLNYVVNGYSQNAEGTVENHEHNYQSNVWTWSNNNGTMTAILQAYCGCGDAKILYSEVITPEDVGDNTVYTAHAEGYPDGVYSIPRTITVTIPEGVAITAPQGISDGKVSSGTAVTLTAASYMKWRVDETVVSERAKSYQFIAKKNVTITVEEPEAEEQPTFFTTLFKKEEGKARFEAGWTMPNGYSVQSAYFYRIPAVDNTTYSRQQMLTQGKKVNISSTSLSKTYGANLGSATNNYFNTLLVVTYKDKAGEVHTYYSDIKQVGIR